VASLSDTRSEIAQRVHLLSPLPGHSPRLQMRFRTPEPSAEVKAWLEPLAARGRYAVVNPGGRLGDRRIPASAFREAAVLLAAEGITPVVTWGPGEEALAGRVVAASDGAAELCFATTLRQLVELARRARVMVAADTGPLHLACAVGTPVVGVFGPTDPARNGPFSPHDEVVRRHGPADGRHRGRFRVAPEALAAIPAREVLEAVDRRLARAAGSAGAV
jgi:heptosyltransferase III